MDNFSLDDVKELELARQVGVGGVTLSRFSLSHASRRTLLQHVATFWSCAVDADGL